MCKPFPPPLVRGGVFLVGLETKYRDIADGNPLSIASNTIDLRSLETKYRDIADGNRHLDYQIRRPGRLETKYRDIADGNSKTTRLYLRRRSVGNQVPRYSGWKLLLRKTHNPTFMLETKYRDIADGNR